MLLSPYRYAVAGGSSHRYWRFVSIVSDFFFFEIAEIQLLTGATVVSEGKTYSAFSGPSSGSPALTALFDGDLSTRCYWTGVLYSDPAFYIQIDLGSAMAVDGVKQAGFDTSGRHMVDFTLQYSDDASSWTTLATKTGLAYPGNNTLSSTYAVP